MKNSTPKSFLSLNDGNIPISRQENLLLALEFLNQGLSLATFLLFDLIFDSRFTP